MEFRANVLQALIRGVVEPDAEGNYVVPICQAGVPSAGGTVYTREVLAAALESSKLRAQIETESCFGELSIGPQMGDYSSMANKLVVNAGRIIMSIRDYSLAEDGLLTATVRPLGAMGARLAGAFANPDLSLRFQLRALITEKEGNEIRNLQVITYDVDIGS